MTDDTHAIARHPVPIGALLGLATLPAHALLPLAWAEQLAALLLVLIAGIYLGFAALDGRPKALVAETSAACAFVAFALWAVLRAPGWLPAGHAAHALWDLAHHRTRHGARHRPRLDVRMPRWYVPFCTVVDAVAGAGIALIWWARG